MKRYYQFGTGSVLMTSGWLTTDNNEQHAFWGLETTDEPHTPGEYCDTSKANPDTILVFPNIQSIELAIDSLKTLRNEFRQALLEADNDEFNYGHNVDFKKDSSEY